VALASLGVVVTMLGIMLPSSILTYTATRWAHQHRDKIGIRAFKSGMAPIVIALLLSTAWLLTLSHDQPAQDWPLYLLTGVTTLLVWRTKLHMLWLIAAGALLGALGWV
jgi:chromate transporter